MIIENDEKHFDGNETRNNIYDFKSYYHVSNERIIPYSMFDVEFETYINIFSGIIALKYIHE